MKAKQIFTAAALAASLVLPFAGCGAETPVLPAPTQPVTAAPATPDGATTASTAQATAESTQPATAKGKKDKKQATTAPSTTEPTSTPVQDNIPEDTVTGANINPNIGGIQGQVIAEMDALAVRHISLSSSKLTLTEGERTELTVSFDPSNAANKSCSVSTDNGCASAKIAGKTVTVTAKSSGTCTVTVKAHSGATAACTVTVKPAQITDNTPLPHKELCTAANTGRWADELHALCRSLGLTHNSQLSGSSIVLSTAAFAGETSFNEMTESLRTAAAAQLQAQTGANFSEYEYNLVAEKTGSEATVTITVSRILEDRS